MVKESQIGAIVDILPLAIVSTLLLLAAIVLLISHVRAWRGYQRDEQLHEAERDYRHKQFRRRMVTSSTLGGLAIAMFAGHLLAIWYQSHVVTIVLWGTILFVLFGLTLLAVVDMAATHRHFSHMRREYLLERAVLQAELRRVQAAGGNGKAHDNPPPTGPESLN